MISGVSIIPLKQIVDERGKIMHMLRSNDRHFQQFGEIYFSCIHPDAIKAWHLHSKMVLNYALLHGRIKFVLYDARPESSTYKALQEIFLGPENYSLVTVPPGVWNGFKGYGSEMSMVANCATIPHDPAEITRLDPNSPVIPYDWSLKNG